MNTPLRAAIDGRALFPPGKRFPVTRFLSALAMFVVLFASRSAANDLLYVIESVDSSGIRTYAAVPFDKYQQMKTDVALRNRYIPLALEAAKKEWKAAHRGISQAFPPNVADTESVTSLGTFTSEEAAQEKLTEINARREQRRRLDADRLSTAEKQIEVVKDRIDHLRAAPRYSITDRILKVRANRLALKLLERDLAESRKKQVRQAEALREARSIFERKLAALLPEAAG